jgi:hypothetical protein
MAMESSAEMEAEETRIRFLSAHFEERIFKRARLSPGEAAR